MPIFTAIRRTSTGYMGVYGLAGIWQASTGILRTTPTDALADARHAAADVMMINETR